MSGEGSTAQNVKQLVLFNIRASLQADAPSAKTYCFSVTLFAKGNTRTPAPRTPMMKYVLVRALASLQVLKD